MAEITTFKFADVLVPLQEEGREAVIEKTFASTASGMNNADTITIAVLPVGVRVTDAWLKHDATLGASATLTARQGGTAITAATTAGGASTVRQTIYPPAKSAAGDKLDILIGGANITAVANVSALFVAVRV